MTAHGLNEPSPAYGRITTTQGDTMKYTMAQLDAMTDEEFDSLPELDEAECDELDEAYMLAYESELS